MMAADTLAEQLAECATKLELVSFVQSQLNVTFL